MQDYRKTLDQLRDEWSECTMCDLGKRRADVGGSFVFGEGHRRGVMFIGEGPGSVEEEEGRPFVGPSGRVLRDAIMMLGLDNFYISNLVSCRSCAQAYDNQGNPITRYDRRTKTRYPLIKDEPPIPLHIKMCSDRLYEEIYLVDPFLIVALGAEAAKALRGKPVSIMSEHGHIESIEIPGAWRVASLTAKRKKWLRKVKGNVSFPTEQNKVRYPMMPILHPAYVLRRKDDKRPGNPLQCFTTDMKNAASLYYRYREEVYGSPPQESREIDPSVLMEE